MLKYGPCTKHKDQRRKSIIFLIKVINARSLTLIIYVRWGIYFKTIFV